MVFYLGLETTGNAVSATLNHRLSCIRGFFKYAAYEDKIYVPIYQSLLTIPQSKITKNKTLEFMSEEALKAILSIPNINNRIGLRNTFFMTLMYDSAARNSEMISLTLKDIVNEKHAPYMFVVGKRPQKALYSINAENNGDIQTVYEKFSLRSK